MLELLVTPVMKSKVVGAICAAFDQLGDLKACPMYARIVNERHFKSVLVYCMGIGI